MKILKYILTVMIPLTIYFGLVGIGKISKSMWPADSNVPDILEGLGVSIIGAFVIACIVGLLFLFYKLAEVITDDLADRLRYYRVRRNGLDQYDDWPDSPTTTVPSPVNEDQAYLQRIGVEEEEGDTDLDPDLDEEFS